MRLDDDKEGAHQKAATDDGVDTVTLQSCREI
jgi:hypothetical protein